MAERFNGRVQREVLGHHRRQPPRPRAAAGRLQLGLQRPPPARPGRALARGGRPRAARRGRAASPTPATGHRPIPASCPRPCWSSSAPRTSRSQTASTTLPRSARSGVPAARRARGGRSAMDGSPTEGWEDELDAGWRRSWRGCGVRRSGAGRRSISRACSCPASARASSRWPPAWRRATPSSLRA